MAFTEGKRYLSASALNCEAQLYISFKSKLFHLKCNSYSNHWRIKTIISCSAWFKNKNKTKKTNKHLLLCFKNVLELKTHSYVFSSYLWILHQKLLDFLILQHGLYQQQPKKFLLEHFQILKGLVVATWTEFALPLHHFAAEVSEPYIQSHWNLSEKRNGKMAFLCLSLWKSDLIWYG